jgi:amino-acid N-acetyltransferase
VSAGDDQLTVRRARTTDVPAIKRLVDTYAGRILLEKNLVTLYEAVQETLVAELDGEIVGCGVLHVLWSDRDLQLQRLFVLTFETDFFSAHGFTEIEGTPVTAEVYEEMCRSYDIGVAEFLDLSYVKPNILGNTRMLLVL